MADKGLAGVLVLVAGVLNVDVKVHLCGSTTGGCFGVAYSNTRRIQGFLRFAKAKAKGEDPKKDGGFIGLYNKMLGSRPCSIGLQFLGEIAVSEILEFWV